MIEQKLILILNSGVFFFMREVHSREVTKYTVATFGTPLLGSLFCQRIYMPKQQQNHQVVFNTEQYVDASLKYYNHLLWYLDLNTTLSFFYTIRSVCKLVLERMSYCL